MPTTNDFTTSVEKSITYDRQSKDYRCMLTIDGEAVSVGYASTYSEGETWCNDEYYRLLTDNVLVPAQPEVAAAPVAETPAPVDEMDTFIRVLEVIEAHASVGMFDDAPLPFEPLPRSHRAYGPQVSWDCMPQAPISTLQDGSTVYGQYDTDDSHFCACAETAGGWSITADEHSVGINHHALGISLDELTPAAWASLKALVNSEAVEHLFTCGAAWDTYQDVPAKQPLTQQQQTRRYVARQFDALLADAASAPRITIEQKVWPDIDEETYTSTVYRYGQAEVLVHHDGVPGNLTAYDLVVNDHNLDARDVQGIRDAAVLLADARVQAALEVIELPVPPTPAVQVARWTEPESGDETGTDYTLGLAELHIPDNGTPPLVWLRAEDGQRCPLTSVEARWWDALADAAALVASAEVQEATRTHVA